MGKEFPVKVRLGAVDRLTAPMNRLTEAFPRLDRSIKKSAQAMRIFNKETEGLQKDLDAVGGKMKSIGGAVTVGLTLPVLAGTALSVKAFMDYETALIGVGKTTNLRGKDLDELGESFREMSKRIPVSTVDLLAVGQAAAQLGVSGSTNILKFTETMAKLSKASNITGEEGATQLARLIAVTKGDIGDVDRFAASIVDLGNNFEVNEAEILGFATRLGSATSLFKVSGQDALGLSTALASMGIQAELGSSAVQRGFLGINNAISKGGSKLQALSMVTGIAADKLKSEFAADSIGVFQKFTEGLGRLQAEGKDVTKALEFFGLTGVGNVQVLGTLASNTDKLNKALGRSREAFTANNALENEFGAFLKSRENQLQLVKNRYLDLAVTVGEKFAPALDMAFGFLTRIADFLSANPWALNLSLGLAAVVAVIGPLILGAGVLLTMLPQMALGLGMIGISTTGAAAGLGAMALTVGVLALKMAALTAAFTAAYAAGSWLTENTGLGRIGEWLAEDNSGEAEAAGAKSVQAGIAKRRSGMQAGTTNREFIQRTNNARVDVTIRDKNNSATITSESENGALSINRGLVGSF